MPRLDPVNTLVKTTTILASYKEKNLLAEALTDHGLDATQSDIAVIYLLDNKQNTFRRYYQRGRFETPVNLSSGEEDIQFLAECRQVLLVNKQTPFFPLFFLNNLMNSALVLPLINQEELAGILVFNCRKGGWYHKEELAFAEGYAKTASSLMEGIELFRDLKDKMRAIDNLQRYQERVFASMTNMLLTTNEQGNLEYFNPQAAQGLHLTEEDLGTNYHELFKGKISPKAVKTISGALKTGEEVVNYQGIFKKDSQDLDFSLNVTPLLGKRGKKEGLTLIFTDQSREKALASEMKTAKEDRRLIKDMFSRYLSQDVVQSLIQQPELVKLGGDKKAATLFFADIRGYTSFSEGKDPSYIVEVLNEYFSQAVEIILKYNGYIDKFIGDCIMAAWGVPMYDEQTDAVKAVSCALEIQSLVKSTKRSFFKGEAKHLQVGIGMNSGPLVAGNLGSSNRMEYSIIGDTVNVAARLEGVAKGGEVIVNHTTRDLLGDHFKLKELEPVKVKGKVKPLPIFSVLSIAQ